MVRRDASIALAALLIAAVSGDLDAQSPPALFPITVDDKHEMIDRAGAWVISPRFAWVRPFHQGLAWVGEPGSRGAYIDATGRVAGTSR
jgi:hypothetical protein